ncbi:CpsD/CapB family tyrosine-protein kinase [Thalassobacillus sp. C254]|uniref:CpsD/CapB family tyrosine-protein kinase n=1 Tax=Thalassobacillus sp. C254 TaxID=1225341 RepID=UPI0006D12349|nr:CpsD/CapB family tyrosine-protein kinase [Thalassobacillus sp. C254]
MLKKFRNKNEQGNKTRTLIAKEQPRSPITEQFRTIRTNIQFAAVDEEVSTIMTTSAGPGDGKSTVNANLAVVMAQQGKGALLIDADMRKPTVHYTFRLPNHVGLSNVVTKQMSLHEAVRPTDVEGLDVLTCGPIPPNPSELLGSRMMKELLEEAKKNYEYIVIDTPPLLAVTDAQVLASICDGVVLVVSSGITVKDEAEKAKELIENTNARLLGAVLNRKEKTSSNYMYYYGS